MRNILRLFAVFSPQAGWLLLGGALALLSLAAQVLLLGSAGGLLLLAGSGLLLLKIGAGARPLLRYCERLATHAATLRALSRLRLWLFGRLVPLAPASLGWERSGDLLGRLLGDINLLDGLYLRLALPVAVSMAGLLAGLVALVAYGFAGLAEVLLLLLSIPLLAAFLLVRRARAGLACLPALGSDVRTHVLDGCRGLADLLAADAGYRQLDRIGQATAALNRVQLVQARLRAMTTLVTALTVAAALVLLGLALPVGPASLLLMLGFLALLESLPALVQALVQIPLLEGAAGRIFSLADRTPAVTEPVAPLPVPAGYGLVFDHVTLSHGRPCPALADVCFTIAPGERVIISGPSGAGKSSLVQLLLKFHAPEQGRIMVDGVDLARLDGDAWRARIACLSQRTDLLAGTVRENLLLAGPRADDQVLWAALRAADLESFVRSLPEGLESWIGESGLQLSGGQARRLALARIWLREAPVWLLDEPTEGLDEVTARSVLKTLASGAQNRTVLLVTHQPEWADLLKPTRHLRLSGGRLLP